VGKVPSGTVTFLFTDIESSSRRWETVPDEMSRALVRHDELVRGAIERHGGHVFATGGDGFAAAFARADDAAAAARDAQRALAGEDGGRGLDLRVRMGMHTGIADERGGDYFGPAVNRAARIMAAGHGGQVLASLATVSTLSDAAGVTDLGMHRLRDLLAPEHLFSIDGDPADHPPLRTLDAHDHNLQVLRSAVFGLDDIVDDVVRELDAHGMLTLTGVGGVGKTRLALESAARMMADHDVTRFVDLGLVADEADVIGAVADSLRLEAADLEAVVSYLGVRRSLLVLDNCEHVLDGVRDVLDVVLRRCPDCAVLATSREPLGVDGEHVRPVRSLPLDRAVELFIARSAAVRPEPAFDDAASRRHIEEICARLDGIPLAIELAAARVTHMSPADIAAHLDERFSLLSGGRRRARQRHQTLQATMDWSYDLLDADERSLLRTLAVFTGGFDAQAAAAVWGHGLLETLDVLGALIDRSLLSIVPVGDTSRYTILETVRLYAQERLVSEGEAEPRRTAHAAHYLDQLRALATDDLVTRTVLYSNYSRTDGTDLENHLAALDWFDEIGQLGRVAEMAWRVTLAHHNSRWVDDRNRYLGRHDVIDRCDQADHALYLAASTLNANAGGRWHDQLRFATLGLGTATGTLRVLLLIQASNAASIVQPDLVADLTDEALRIAGDEAIRLVVRNRQVGDLLVAKGELDRAHDALHEIRAEVHRVVPTDRWRARLDELPFIELILGHHDHILEAPSEARTTWSEGRRQCALAVIEATAGNSITSAGHLVRAADELDAGVRLLEHDFTIAAALCAVHLGQPEHACRLLASVPLRVMTHGSFQLLLHSRRLVRAELDHDTVAAIRAEMTDVDPTAIRREELVRLRAIADVSAASI
jgi:predicted ATPase/class 3 adenylate cyclase